jgi:hypothetical protein
MAQGHTHKPKHLGQHGQEDQESSQTAHVVPFLLEEFTVQKTIYLDQLPMSWANMAFLGQAGRGKQSRSCEKRT